MINDQIRNLPYIDVTVRLYKTSDPISVDADKRVYFAAMAYLGAEVDDGNKELGSLSMPFGGGQFVRLNRPTEEGTMEEWYLPAEELWEKVTAEVGFLQEQVDDDTHKLLTEKIREFKDEYREGLIAPAELEEDEQPAVLFKPEENEIPAVAFPEPDYNTGGTTSKSGSLDEIPTPWYFMFNEDGTSNRPDDDNRSMTITILKYATYPHYYVTMKEEDNLVWDGRPKDYDPSKPEGWVRFYHEKRLEGRTEWDLPRSMTKQDKHGESSLHTFDINRARQMVKEIIKLFPNHKIVFEDYTGTNISKDWGE